MHGNQTFIAVIPARAGSKGIPGKNLREVGGRPLIEHTIDAALGSAHLDMVCVTSDDPRVLAIARNAGVTVVDRPAHLAGDTARSIDVIVHALWAVGSQHDAVALLQPTSPMRRSRHIDEAIELFARTGRPVASVSPVRESPLLIRTMADNGELTPLLTGTSTVRRQDMPEYWRVNGAVYVNPVAGLSTATSLNGNPVGYQMDAVAGIDVDEPVDLVLARSLAAPAALDLRLSVARSNGG